MNKKEIVFWGVEPPPIGGMSVHIKRLSDFLLLNEWKVYQYNFNRNIKREEKHIINVRNLWLWYLKLWFYKSPKVHYVITTSAIVRFLASILTLRGKKILIRVGGRSLEKDLEIGGIKKLLNILSLKLCTSFIGVSEEICNLALRYIGKNKINYITGFIPPIGNVNSPSEINYFFDSNNLNIVVTGQIVDENKEDIYGLHHVLDSLVIAKEKGINFKCCIVSYTISGDNTIAISNFKRKITLLELNSHVLLYQSNNELWPILKGCDLFIRSSITDGDANSIREALFFDKIVIASDCVLRPIKCVLYKTLDSYDLVSKIESFQDYKVLNIDENFSNSNKLQNHYLILQLLNKLVDIKPR